MTPELIGILAVGATLTGVGATMIGLLLTFRREARDDMQALQAEFRADIQRLRAEMNAGLAGVRKDVQALTKRVSRLEERVSRLECVIQGLFAGRRDRDRHHDAA